MYEKGRKHGAAAGWRTNPSAHLLHCGGSDGLRPQQAERGSLLAERTKRKQTKGYPFPLLAD